MSLTNDQYLLLQKVGQYSDANRRTDAMARCLANFPREHGGKWDNSHVPFIGLQLRDQGYVSTYKDHNDYARWDITPVGKAKLLEEKARREALTRPVPVPPARYAAFDTSDSGMQEFATYEKAEAAAAKWAKENDGADVYLVQIVGVVKAETVIKSEKLV